VHCRHREARVAQLRRQRCPASKRTREARRAAAAPGTRCRLCHSIRHSPQGCHPAGGSSGQAQRRARPSRAETLRTAAPAYRSSHLDSRFVNIIRQYHMPENQLVVWSSSSGKQSKYASAMHAMQIHGSLPSPLGSGPGWKLSLLCFSGLCDMPRTGCNPFVVCLRARALSEVVRAAPLAHFRSAARGARQSSNRTQQTLHSIAADRTAQQVRSRDDGGPGAPRP
jgi:hypothetical protein